MKPVTNLRKIALWLFLLGLFFIPFNSFEGFGILGEYDRDSCVLFFLMSSLFVFLTGKIKIPYKNLIFQLLMVMIAWFIISVAFNGYDLTQYYFKHTSGISRFVRQLIALLISTIVLFITFYNIIENANLKEIFFKVRKVFSYSLFVVVVYGSIEFLIVKLKMDGLRPTLYLFDYFPFTSVNIDKWTNRISSVTFEPPALATYLLSIAGWMFSYILTGKTFKRFIPGLLVIIFSFLSESRAVFFIIIVQAFVFVLYLIKDRKYNKLFVKIALISVFASSAVLIFFMRTTVDYVYNELTSFKIDDGVHSTSNKTRFGIQTAMYEVFLENPIIGTGYGLQAFESKDKYPEWATVDNWEFRLKHLNEDHVPFPPGFNLYLRILAETGIIGFIILILFLISILLWCYNKAFKKQNEHTIIALVVTISMVGFVFNWLKTDTFRVYAFWLCLAFIMVMIKSNKKLINESK
ncbi:O-antigen ligase family protein [Winogradskyella costae]|uniref:O-antigen ligase family protein n=1 Tax=Winogradskyella costae TaxID=2697008 RepID=UPI0015CDA4E4|nr:O-antigen ligase family protein [Winogradskyella costae]